MARVLVTDPIHDSGVQLLRKEHEVVVEELDAVALPRAMAGYEALVVRSRTKVTREVLSAGGRLKVVGRAGVGVDNVDTAAAKELGIAIVNAPTAATNAVAELAVGHALALARGIARLDGAMRQGRWEKKGSEGWELAGKTLGLVGVGRIGSRVAELARAFGMRALAYDPYVSADAARRMNVEKVDSLERLLEDADVVSVHVSLTPETKGLLDGKRIALMKRTAILLNLSRGGVVDEPALAMALESGAIAGAGLDVFSTEPLAPDSPLARLPNVILTPHVGANSREAQAAAGRIVAEQVLKVLRGETADFRVV
ncbi:MAG TPA: hydroxyacid dehydrogenase [Candidatus Thermoplasmatota archaeon]|nr:hydroxyacid dehydrogenase [Candidatus Thermoplasmatota archaeon]